MGRGIVREWAGKDRLFRLKYGQVLDLERACDQPVGTIFKAVTSADFSANHLRHTLYQALIGGGESAVEARLLTDEQFEAHPLILHAALAGEILADLMLGVEAEVPEGEGVPERLKLSDMAGLCERLGLSPNELLNTDYDAIINMVHGLNKANNDKIDPPSEEEYLAMLARHRQSRTGPA